MKFFLYEFSRPFIRAGTHTEYEKKEEDTKRPYIWLYLQTGK